jgi:hypothetical protein
MRSEAPKKCSVMPNTARPRPSWVIAHSGLGECSGIPRGTAALGDALHRSNLLFSRRLGDDDELRGAEHSAVRVQRLRLDAGRALWHRQRRLEVAPLRGDEPLPTRVDESPGRDLRRAVPADVGLTTIDDERRLVARAPDPRKPVRAVRVPVLAEEGVEHRAPVPRKTR